MIRHFPPSLIVTDVFRERSDRSWNRGHAIERLSSNATTPLFQKFALHLTHFNVGFMREELGVGCLHPLSFPYRLFLLINWDIKDPDHSGLWASGYHPDVLPFSFSTRSFTTAILPHSHYITLEVQIMALPSYCNHSFNLLKSESTLIQWVCSMCHGGPHWYIFECKYCKLKTCRPCTNKV
jgi:hypothetical protein